MSTDISVPFINHYMEALRRFNQRHVPNYFLFVPLSDTGPDITEVILKHSFSDGMPKQIIKKLHKLSF